MSEEIKQNDSELDSLIKTKLDEAVTSPTTEDGSAPLVVDDTKTPLQQMQEYNDLLLIKLTIHLVMVI